MSRWRLVAGWSFVGALALALAGVLFFESRDVDPQALVGSAMGEHASQPAPATGSPTAAEPARPAPVPTASPAEVAPATGDFAALSHSTALTHPDTDPEIAKWYDSFGYYRPGEYERPTGAWTNKSEIWDSLAPHFRAEALSLGRENDTPEWPEVRVIPASANVRWSNEDTLGRGELVEFAATLIDGEDRQIERIWPVLVRTDADGSGEVVAKMPPFDLIASDYDGYEAQARDAGQREWAWVLSLEKAA